jgi:hypothetical protein
VKGEPPAVVEQRMVFPLSAGDKRIWNPKNEAERP